MTQRANPGAIIAGLLFIIVGALLATDAYASWDIAPRVLWPGLLIGGGLVMLARSQRTGGT